MPHADAPCVKTLSRRAAIQDEAIGWGLSTAHLTALRALENSPEPKANSVIFIFLIGGLSHQDTFDMKPEAPLEVRGEFGRTPKINARAGRDHWALVNTMMFFGGGVQGGNIIGASDRTGSETISDRQTPENFSATIYEALGNPRTGIWQDVDGRPHHIYRGQAIQGLYL